MQESKKRQLKSVYSACFSILTVVVGLLFIVQTWSIFRSAEQDPFTMAKISEAFSQIVVPVVCWGIGLLVNIVLGYAIPDEKERPKAYFETGERITRLKKRLPTDSPLQNRDKTDIITWAINGVALIFALVAIVVSLVYLFDKSYTPLLPEPIFVEHNAMTDRVLRALVWCAGGMILLVAVTIFSDVFAKKKEEKIKREIAENAKNGVRVAIKKDEKIEKSESKKAVWIVRGVLATVGIVFVITGICNGGMADVLKKAINICTQCIGLG